MPNQAEADLSALIASTDDLIWSVDLDYCLAAFNPAFQRAVQDTFGIRVEIGMSSEGLLPPDRAALFPPFYQRALTQGPFRADYSTIDGRTLEMAFNPIVVDGKTVGVSVFGKDISPRKATELALSDSEARFRRIFEQNGSVMLLVDPSNGTIVDANHAAEGFYGYSHQQLVGLPITRINTLPWEEILHRREPVLRGETNHLDFRHRLAGGDVRDVEVYLSPIDLEGRKLDFAVVHDVTERRRAEELLRESAAALLEAQRVGGLGSYLLDIPSGEWKASEVLDEIFGIGKLHERNVASWIALIHPKERDSMAAYFADEVVAKGTAFDREYRIVRHSDGAERWVHGMGKLVFDDQGRPVRLHGIIKDITERRRSELLLLASEARYRTVFQTSLDSVTITHLESGKYIDANQAFLDCTGFDRDEISGHSVLDINLWANPRDRKNLVDLLRRESQCQNLETRFRRKNGELFSALVSAAVIELDGAPCIAAFMRDISSVKAAAEKIRDLAFYDPLTHLPNRRLLMERLRQVLATGARSNRKGALLLVDLDHFKTLNDTLGHEAGDSMLQEAAQRLLACIHAADTVAHLGGDEFVVVLEDLSETPEEAAALAQAAAESILAAIGRPFLLEDHEYHSSASIGITVFGVLRESPGDLMQKADIAMCQAKAAGRNTLSFFAPALQAAVHARAALEGDLRQAIRSNQFVLYYQPQVDGNGLMGAEALLRWNHPRRGLLAPGEFIPLAEDTGLILPLGEWVLQTACAQIAAWALRPHADRLSLAVNISARQFRQPDFVEQVLAALERTGATPQSLDLELTESMLFEDVEDVIAKMTLLKAHGVRFSLDDFGTGYSSLSYLKRLPLDQLKIDRSFVQDILDDVGSRAIAQSVISLGKALGLTVIAEGVETTEQRDLLTSHGCHAFQGFLYSRPLPLDDYQRLWLDPATTPVPA